MPVGTTLKGWGRAVLLRTARTLGIGGLFGLLIFLGLANIFVDSAIWAFSVLYDGASYCAALLVVYLGYRLFTATEADKDAQIAVLRVAHTDALARNAALERELREARGEPEPAPTGFLSRFR